MAELWERFAAWTRDHGRELREWLDLHRTDRIANVRDTGSQYVERVWLKLPKSKTLRFVGVAEHDLKYAFDVFVRTIRYQAILGEATVFFPHPLRAEARLKDERSFDGMSWSWGRFLASQMNSPKTRNSKWLLDQVSAIRNTAARFGADGNWYSLARRSPSEQATIIQDMAAAAGFPATLKLSAQSDAKLLMSAVTAAGSKILAPLASVALSMFSAFVGAAAPGHVPARFARWKLVRGRVEWPSLLNPR
jgi:hypothetical protein